MFVASAVACMPVIAAAQGAGAQPSSAQPASAQAGVEQAAAPLDSASWIALLRSSCGESYAHVGSGLIRGRVVDESSHAVGSVAVTVAWRRPLEMKGTGANVAATTDLPALGYFTDPAGRWRACGAPLNTPLAIRAIADEGTDVQTVTLDAEHPLAIVDFSLRPAETGGGTAHAQQTSALVVFSVEDREGHAIVGARLQLATSNGPAREVVSDSEGRAILPAVEPGRAMVKSLAIGYKPGELYVPLDVGRNTVPLVLDAAHIPTLATIRVIGDRKVLARHADFEARRASHLASTSITQEDIEKRNPLDTWQMLTNVPSMRVIAYGQSGTGVYAMSNREQPVTQRRGAAGGATTAPCWYHVMIDGVMLQDNMPDLNAVLPAPSEVHGIEVFAGLATIPPQYNHTFPDADGKLTSNSCGLIAVWTK